MPKPKKRKSTQASSSERFVIRVKKRQDPDLRRLARALIDLAFEDLAAEIAVDEQANKDERRAA